jgi:hypothetical protein
VPVVLEQPLEQPDEARIVLDDEQVHIGQPTFRGDSMTGV